MKHISLSNMFIKRMQKRGRTGKLSISLWLHLYLQLSCLLTSTGGHTPSRSHHRWVRQVGSTVLSWLQVVTRVWPTHMCVQAAPPAWSCMVAQLISKHTNKYFSRISSKAKSLPVLDSFKGCFLVKAYLMVYPLLKDRKKNNEKMLVKQRFG